MPYLNSGGVIAESAEAAAAIVEKAKSLGSEMRIKYIEYRSTGASPNLESRLPAAQKPRVTMVLPLPRDPEQLFSSFSPKLRSQIRGRAVASGKDVFLRNATFAVLEHNGLTYATGRRVSSVAMVYVTGAFRR